MKRTIYEEIKHLEFIRIEKKEALQNFSEKYPPQYRVLGSPVCRILVEMGKEIIDLEEKIHELMEKAYGKIQFKPLSEGSI